jgi:hypothetical protein
MKKKQIAVETKIPLLLWLVLIIILFAAVVTAVFIPILIKITNDNWNNKFNTLNQTLYNRTNPQSTLGDPFANTLVQPINPNVTLFVPGDINAGPISLRQQAVVTDQLLSQQQAINQSIINITNTVDGTLNSVNTLGSQVSDISAVENLLIANFDNINDRLTTVEFVTSTEALNLYLLNIGSAQLPIVQLENGSFLSPAFNNGTCPCTWQFEIISRDNIGAVITTSAININDTLMRLSVDFNNVTVFINGSKTLIDLSNQFDAMEDDFNEGLAEIANATITLNQFQATMQQQISSNTLLVGILNDQVSQISSELGIPIIFNSNPLNNISLVIENTLPTQTIYPSYGAFLGTVFFPSQMFNQSHIFAHLNFTTNFYADISHSTLYNGKILFNQLNIAFDNVQIGLSTVYFTNQITSKCTLSGGPKPINQIGVTDPSNYVSTEIGSIDISNTTYVYNNIDVIGIFSMYNTSSGGHGLYAQINSAPLFDFQTMSKVPTYMFADMSSDPFSLTVLCDLQYYG